jgi:hypothetical protein
MNDYNFACIPVCVRSLVSGVKEGTYKEPSIIPWAGAVIWSKINFGPIGHHHSQSSLLPRVCTIPHTSAIS